MNKKYPDEFKQGAARQVLEKYFSIPSVALLG
jgi:transposase-like protein